MSEMNRANYADFDRSPMARVSPQSTLHIIDLAHKRNCDAQR